MTIWGEQTLVRFARKHSAARKPLTRFLEMVREAEWRHLPDVKESFPATDYTAKSHTYVFDVSGNKYRLLASIDFQAQVLSIEAVLTHEEYNRKAL